MIVGMAGRGQVVADVLEGGSVLVGLKEVVAGMEGGEVLAGKVGELWVVGVNGKAVGAL